MPEPDLLSMIMGDAPDPVAHAQELAAGAPPPARPLQQPFAERPWHEQFSQSAEGTPLESARTYLENTGDTFMGGTADELGSEIMSPQQEMYSPDKNQGYESPFPAVTPDQGNDYAAGSQVEDARRTLETEKQERAGADPSSAFAGKLTGGVIQGSMLPAGREAQILGGAALTGANMLGEGSGDLGERADQAVEQAKEHPFATGMSVGIPAVAPAVAKGANWASDAFRSGANRNTTAAFMTAPQLAALEQNQGRGAVERLGANVREQGLHKQPWYKFWLAPNAKTFYDNSIVAKKAAGDALEASENKIVAKGNPSIQVGSVADDLEGAAGEVGQRMDQSAGVPEAKFMREQAQNVRNVTRKPAEGPTEAFYEEQPFTSKGGSRDFVEDSMEAVEPSFTSKGGNRDFVGTAMEPVEPPFFPSGASRQAPPRVEPKDWFEYLEQAKANPDLAPPLATKPGGVFEGPDRPPEFQPSGEKTFTAEGPDRLEFEKGPEKEFTAEGPDREPLITGMGEPPLAETGELPFDRTLKDLRYINRNIDHGRTGGGPDAPMQEQVRRRMASQIRDKIDEGLDDAVGTGQLQADDVTEWKDAKLKYGTAAAVEDPALALMQRDYGGTMGLKDMAGAGMMSAFGMPGPAAVATSAGMKGRWPGFKANRLESLANQAKGVEHVATATDEASGAIRGAATHPVAVAKEENPGAPKSTIIQSANDSLKEQLKKAQGWFSSLTD